MTLTRGSFTYASGEEYHGEWKEGQTSISVSFQWYPLVCAFKNSNTQQACEFHHCKEV